MKLIVGLGNPGAEYKNSRHNIGFGLIDRLSNKWEIELKRRKHQGRCGGGMVGFERVILLKPMTFMNRSGASVAEAVNFYKVPLEDVLVIVDDLALEIGSLRIRPKGSAGGHNGLKDIIARLGSNEYCRLRVGIGSARGDNVVSHVLGNFSEDELDGLSPVISKSVDVIECWMNEGIQTAMTEFNTSVKKKKDSDKES